MSAANVFGPPFPNSQSSDDAVTAAHKARLARAFQDSGEVVNHPTTLSMNQFGPNVGIHRILDLHLQNQVDSPLQVEPEVNVIRQSREQGLSTQTLRNAKDSEQEE